MSSQLDKIEATLKQNQGIIDQDVLTAVYEQKLFKCFLPQSLGGLGLNVKQTLQVIEDCAAIDGSLGWLIQIGNGGNYFAPLYEASVTEQLFSPPNAVLAGSGAATGVATKAGGGYRVNGKWAYCSGADYATFFTANCQIADTTDIIACTFMREQVRIVPDWNAVGLQQTSTHTIEVQDAFVPDELTFVLDLKKCLQNEPVFQVPFVPFAQLFIIKVLHGIFRAFLAAADTVRSDNKSRWQPARLQTLEDKLLGAGDYLSQALSKCNELAEQLTYPTDTEKTEQTAETAKELTRQNTTIVREAQEIFRLSGMQVLYRNHPLSARYLDLLCAGQHSLLHDTGR
ncbi:MAG: hypothetical protein MUD08_09565 [Cytophagales bacterium]|nr:hypothetical protein [Cytophagales bacterium]